MCEILQSSAVHGEGTAHGVELTFGRAEPFYRSSSISSPAGPDHLSFAESGVNYSGTVTGLGLCLDRHVGDAELAFERDVNVGGLSSGQLAPEGRPSQCWQAIGWEPSPKPLGKFNVRSYASKVAKRAKPS